MVAFVAIGSYFFIVQLKNQQQAMSQVYYKDLATHVARHYRELEQSSNTTNGIVEIFNELVALGPFFEHYLLDSQGRIQAFSATNQKIKLAAVDIVPIKLFLQNLAASKIRPQKIRFPIYGTNPLDPTHKSIFSVAPIQSAKQLKGYIYIVFRSDQTANQYVTFANTYQPAYIASLLATLAIFIVLLILILNYFVVRPLKLLRTHTNQKALRQPDQTLYPKIKQLTYWQKNSSNEFHQVGTALRTTLKMLTLQRNRLIESDQSQRTFFADFSHDLRSPMASLLGYLETYLLYFNSACKFERKHYIETAYESAKKINQLTKEIFDGTDLDYQETSMNLEPLPIADFCQEILKNYQVKAKTKNITLQLKPCDSSVLVMGDIEKLDRVLNNLIENAIRHTLEGGKVIVSIRNRKSFVRITVVDNGVGIPQADLPYIFDAQDTGQDQTHAHTVHSGLGLAIAKRLLELHQTTIEVDSVLHGGTRFDFYLRQTQH